MRDEIVMGRPMDTVGYSISIPMGGHFHFGSVTSSEGSTSSVNRSNCSRYCYRGSSFFLLFLFRRYRSFAVGFQYFSHRLELGPDPTRLRRILYRTPKCLQQREVLEGESSDVVLWVAGLYRWSRTCGIPGTSMWFSCRIAYLPTHNRRIQRTILP